MKIDKLLNKAINNPRNLRFSEFQNLLEHYGFVCTRKRGSHFVYSNDEYKKSLPIQENNGYAKVYQVGQFLEILEENDAI